MLSRRSSILSFCASLFLPSLAKASNLTVLPSLPKPVKSLTPNADAFEALWSKGGFIVSKSFILERGVNLCAKENPVHMIDCYIQVIESKDFAVCFWNSPHKSTVVHSTFCWLGSNQEFLFVDKNPFYIG